MGISGLARRLEPYATHLSEHLHGYFAVVDGPGLAYHAQSLATNATVRLNRLPSYSEINDEAIRWLTSLESHNIKV